MASYRGHLMFSSVLGGAYGSFGVLHLNMQWGPAFLGAGLTAIGGLLPDLDSDSGVPVRELFGLSAAVTPMLLYPRLRLEFDPEQTLVILGGVYLLIRYGLSSVFKSYTVHRGMFHSIPAMLIAGLATFLAYHSADQRLRYYIAGGVMVGFLSHLVLDELYSVDFMGVRIKLNKFAGSAVKFWSPSMLATAVCYAILGALGYLAWKQYFRSRGELFSRTSKIRAIVLLTRPYRQSRLQKSITTMNLANGTHVSVDRLAPHEGGDAEHLRTENEELRSLVLELEQALRHHPSGDDGDARTREYEALLEEKSELIRNLHRKVQVLEHELAKSKAAPAPQEAPKPVGPLPREEELMRLSEELEHERRQLKEDEESLMEQMREMEVQMARERAEMARQRNELQRLQTDLHHELELAARDATLRERLAPLQRRHLDVTTRKGAAPGSHTQQPAPQQEPEQAPAKKSGFFKRLFG